jgi:hypothetical protein
VIEIAILFQLTKVSNYVSKYEASFVKLRTKVNIKKRRKMIVESEANRSRMTSPVISKMAAHIMRSQ